MPSETTFCFEDHLPRFPVPDFQDTLKRYLASARIIVSEEQYKKTEALVKEFGKQGGIGEQLHEAIVERAKTTDNWLTDWWTKYVYLKPRESIVLNISVATIAGYEPVQSEDDYITLAAKAAVATATYYWQIYHQTLPVNKSGGAPLAMFQSMNLFGSSRIPKHSIDEFAPRNLDDEPSSDLIISHNNQFFIVKAIKDDKVISFTEMKIQIQRVIQMSTEVVEPVGILTTADRETWADALQLLTQDPENYQSWHAIHRAITVISLEMIKCEPNVQPDHPNYQDELYSLFTSEGLHANGSQYNSANRWNDKIVACYVGRHGNYGTLGEHSHVDGVTVVYYNVFLDQQIKMMETGKSVPQEVSNQVEPPKKIQWRLNDELHQVIRQTAEKFDKTLKNVNQRGMIFNDYGKEFIKSIGISPDSFIQMALQLTYYILERKLPNQYESCTLARYARGRTEAIRATTPKSKILCKIWIDPKSTLNEKKAAFMEATKSQSQLAKEAGLGKAWDRILFGIRIAALEKGLPEPEIFNDPTFKLMNQFQLSTSQGTYGPISNSLFVPVHEEGYGISYNIQSDRFTFACSDFVSCEKTSSKKYLDTLRQFLGNFKRLFTEEM